MNVRYMLEGTPVRMRFVNRWATGRVLFPENVAEHSWFVAFYSMILARAVSIEMPPTERDAFLGEVLQRAVLHDIEEARSGDIHRGFKYSSPRLIAALKQASEDAAHQTLSPLFGSGTPETQRLDAIWARSKDDTRAGRIVRFSDFLAVLAFILQEGPASAKYLDVEPLARHALEFEEKQYEFLRTFVEEAKQVTLEILENVRPQESDAAALEVLRAPRKQHASVRARGAGDSGSALPPRAPNDPAPRCGAHHGAKQAHPHGDPAPTAG